MSRTLCRIISYLGTVYVYERYPVYETKPKSGRIITGIPEACYGGLKPGRLGQFNQTGLAGEYVLICRPEDLNWCLGFFLRKTRLERITFRVPESHPLWDRLAARAAKNRQAEKTPRPTGLRRERRTFKRERARLLAEGHAGKWVVIKGKELVGIYADMQEALRAGYDRFGLEQFMVKEIAEKDRIYRV